MMDFGPQPETAERTYACRLHRFGERIAVVTEPGEKITYAELSARADAFAGALGDRRRLVCVEAMNALEPLVAMLGAMRAAHPVLLLPAGGINGRTIDLFRPSARFHRDGAGWRLDLTEGEESLHPDLALLLATSGSTGESKLVRLSHSAVDANAGAIGDFLQIGPDEAAITSLPFHYSYGLSVVASHLARGARLLLTDRSVIEPEFWAFAGAQGATSLAGVPYTYELLERIGFRDKAPDSLRTLTQAGGALAPHLAGLYRRWTAGRGGQFYTMYGQTEATARMGYVPPDREPSGAGAIGIAIPGGAFSLRELPGQQTNGPVHTGELIYSGPNVMMGYAEGPDDLGRGAGPCELATGDIAELRSDGLYYIVGRKSRFSKLFGLRISLEAIQQDLQARGHDVVVAGDDDGIVIAGPRVPRSLSEELADLYRLPASCVATVELAETPRLPSGKVNYPAILAFARQQGSVEPYSGDLRAAFEAAFPGRAIGPRDTFLSLGGDSLNYVNLSLAIEGVLGRVPLNWETLSLAELEGTPVKPARPSRRRFFSEIETEVLVRAAAILAVVVHHAGHPRGQGGALVLLLLVGFNMARYQRANFANGASWEALRSLLVRVILPGYVITVAYLIFKREPDIASLLMISNFRGRFHSVIEPYWFLEALLQCTLVFAAMFSLRPMQDLARRSPWRLGLGMIAAFLALRFAAFAAFHHSWLVGRTPDSVLYVIAIGWTVRASYSAPQKIATTLAVAASAALNLVAPWNSGGVPHLGEPAALVLVTCALLWTPRVVLLRWLNAAIALVAASSFWIYLTHQAALTVLLYRLHQHNLAIALAVSLALGLTAWRLAALMQHALAKGVAERPSSWGLGSDEAAASTESP